MDSRQEFEEQAKRLWPGGMESDLDTVVNKFQGAYVSSHLQAQWQGWQAARNSLILRVADLTLDRIARTIDRGGKRIELTPHEFTLLELLMLRKGQFIGKHEIERILWSSRAKGCIDSNVVGVYMSYLRIKLNQPGKPSLIESKSRVGYRIAEPGGKRVDAK